MFKSALSSHKQGKEVLEDAPIQMDNLINDHFSCGFTVQELKNIRTKLLRPIRFLRTKDLEYMNVEEGNLADAYFVNDLERNYVFLWAAFTRDDVALLQKLHQLGADVNFVYPSENLNALHLSALRGSTECTRWLLEEGCEIIDTTLRLSPLHFAIFGKAPQICRQLVEKGCRVDTKALHMAVYASSQECVNYLLELQVPVNGYDESGKSALHVAANIGDVQLMRLLLNDKRIDVHAKTVNSGYTALHLAAENGHEEALTLLLDSGLNIDARSFKRQTALHLACKETFVDCVNALLKRGADINAQDHEKRTPLHAAVSNSLKPMQIQVVRLLTNCEADAHLADKFGCTALHTAALNELDECVEHLILYGANSTAKTNGNMTALNIMKRKTPACLRKIEDRLDLCMEYNTEQTFKYSFRDINRNSIVGEVSYLYTLQKEGTQSVLEHPVCEAFLYLKWQKVRPLILLRIFVSLLTVVLLSSLVSWGIKEPECYRHLMKPLIRGCGEHEDANSSLPSTTNSSSLEGCTVKQLNVNLTNSSFEFSMTGCLRNTCNKDNKLLDEPLSPDSNQSTMRLLLYCDSEVQDTADHQVCHTNEDILNAVFENYTFVPPVVLVIIILLLIANIIRLIFTIPAYKSVRHFFMQYSNLMEIVVTSSVSFTLINLCAKNLEEDVLKKSFASLTLLCSWAYMMITVSQLPDIGTHVAMFKAVLKEFIKMKITFLCLIMGFMFTFYTLKKNFFPNPIIAFTKVMAMMTGELDTGSLLTPEEGERGVTIHMYITAFVLTIFLMSITIVLMNLLVGIAVNDVEGLRKNANLSKLIQQTKLIYFLEKACFRGYFPAYVMNFLRKFMYMWPDSYTGIMFYVRPLDPNEKRLPRPIMEESIARLHKKKLKEKNKKLKEEKRTKRMEEKMLKLYELVSGLPETMTNELRRILEANNVGDGATTN